MQSIIEWKWTMSDSGQSVLRNDEKMEIILNENSLEEMDISKNKNNTHNNPNFININISCNPLKCFNKLVLLQFTNDIYFLV